MITAGIIFLWGLQLQVLLEITKFHLHQCVPGAGIIRIVGIIQGRAHSSYLDICISQKIAF